MAANNSKVEQESETSVQNTADMTAYVQNLLDNMQKRFQVMSENIVSKIDEMGGKINELEKSISDLKAEMGMDSMTESKTDKVEPSDPAGQV